MNLVGIVMGSDSDFQVMEEALKVLKEFDISCEVKVSSAHRTLERTLNWFRNSRSRGVR